MFAHHRRRSCSSPLDTFRAFFCLVAAIHLTCPAIAHDSPEHKVQQISSELARSGKSPALLMERGFEHRALAEFADAAADFEAAYRLDPNLAVALKELALTQLAQNETDAALSTINRALVRSDKRESLSQQGESVERASAEPDFLMARAEIHTARKEYRSALDDCDAALRTSSNNLEWHLLRAQLQRRLGLFRECLKNLQHAFQETGSAVLQEELIDAQIDAGDHKAALARIDRELADTRWRSSWLIRRARARIGLGDHKAATRDLHAAIKELNKRIVPDAPEVTLLIDRGVAYALLNNHSAACLDLDRARTLSADWAMLLRLEHVIVRSSPTR